jgi:PEP-CTERM motif
MNRHTARIKPMLVAAALAAVPWIAHANVFGTGNNGVYAEQQRFEKEKSKGSNGPSNHAPAHAGPSGQSVPEQVNQVPEPGSLPLLVLGLAAAWAVSRRRKD